MGLLAMAVFQTVANQGREGKQRQGKRSRETPWQPWGRVCVPLQGMPECERALSLQLCLTLCDTMDCSPPASSIHGVLQARILEWVAIASSTGDLLNPGIKPMSPAARALKACSLPLSRLGGSPLRDIQNNFFEHLTELKLPINGGC